MVSNDRLHKILEMYRRNLKEILGGDLDFVILYGSQARGESIEGSDIDVLCVMKRAFNYGDLINQTSQVTADMSLMHDIVISRAFVTHEAYKSRRSPFLMNVHKEQIAI